MTPHVIFLLTFLIFGCSSQKQNSIFEKEEKKAKAFMESQINEIYGKDFKTEFIGTWHEFGKIYTFEFYIIENNKNPIKVEYQLHNNIPFKFEKEIFEKEYELIKNHNYASEKLEKVVCTYFADAKVLAKKIEDYDESIRWLNEIYTAVPLDNNNEKTFFSLDSLCKLYSLELEEREVIYNFYFPRSKDNKKYSDNRNSFFEFENFKEKYIYHYRVDLRKTSENFVISKRKLYDNYSDEEIKNLKETIIRWNDVNKIYKDWKLTFLTNSKIDRDLNQLKFLLKSQSGEKKFGFINVDSKVITFEE